MGKKWKIISNMLKNEFHCSREGLTIGGTEYRPEGDNLPIAIVSHGFMANQKSVRHYAKLLASMGYASYCFDFNGGSAVKSKSSGKTVDMSVLTEVKDLEAVISYAKERSYTNSEQIVLMGCSQGGFVSALEAAKGQENIQKLILFYPALCIPDDARAGSMMFARFDPKNPPEVINCGPMKLGKCYPLAVMDMNPFEEIKKYQGNVLIVHGTADKIVNVDYAKRAKEAYLEENSNREVRLELIENGAHGFARKNDKMAMEMVKEFLTVAKIKVDMKR